MGYYSAVVGVLTLVAFASASVGDNSIDSGDRVVLVSPVLAPPQDSKIHSSVRARQFPILVLLAQQNPSEYAREPQAKSLQRNPQPIYVQKLEDQEPQEQPTLLRKLNRQRRHLHKKYFGYSYGGGGGGGCQQCGYQQPVHYQPQPQVYYQPVQQYQPPPQIIVKVIKGYQSGGSPCGNGNCGGGGHHYSSPCDTGNCGGGGNYGGGHSSATATATATASAQSYGKK